MRLSVDTSALRNKVGEEEAIRLIAEAGFDCISFDFSPDVLGEDYAEAADRLRTCMHRNGISCNQTHAPYCMRLGDRFDMTGQKYRMVVRAIEASSILGAQNVVFHASDVTDERGAVDPEAYNEAYFRSLEGHAKRNGVHISLENLFHWDPKTRAHFRMFSSPEALCGLLDRLSSPVFNACVDVGHAFITGMHPEDFLRGMKSGQVKALHVHDTDYISDRHRLPFMEDIEWNEVMRALKEIGYDGDLTFEICGFLSKYPKELLGEALRLAEKTGRYLIRLFEETGKSPDCRIRC